MRKFTRLFHVFIMIALFLSACNLPSNDPEAATVTAAAQTLAAFLNTTATFTPVSAAPTFTPSPQPTNTGTPTPTATPVCPQAQFVTDVTIPDGTIMTPGQTFVKKWRIRNTGQCAWNGYSLVFDSGESMGGPASKPIGVVNPGQEIDLEVNLTAPNTAGNYKGYWRIVTNSNVLVPMLNGVDGKTFYLDIKVQSPPTNTTPPFAVTSVNITTSGACGGFTATANIVTNGAGTVTYYWKFSDNATTSPATINFASAGTQSVSYTWNTTVPSTPPNHHWIDIYIVSPNNQQFGRATFTCP